MPPSGPRQHNSSPCKKKAPNDAQASTPGALEDRILPSAHDAPSDDGIQVRLGEIRQTRARLLAELCDVSREHGSWHPDGAWSLQQVVEHLVLAERGGFELIWEAAEAYRAGEPVWAGDSENRGLGIEEIVGRTWRPRENAPPSAEPTGFGSLSLWTTELSSCDTLLGYLPAHLQGLPLERVVYPHFLCGPLDALQRLDFIRYHMEHHLPQIRRLREAQGIQEPHGAADPQPLW